MYTSTILASLVAVASLTKAIPVVEKKAYGFDNDGLILNYALTLEYLERKFYQEGIANYSQAAFVKAGFPDPFYADLKEIYVDEQTHVSVLAGALTAAGIQPTNELVYCFPTTDARSFVTLSSLLEGVGVSAYLGAAASIANPGYLTVAGTILTIEARHNAIIRAALGQSPFPAPFDTPLDFNQVHTLAVTFICGGSSPVTLPVKAFPTLSPACTQFYYEEDRSSVTFVNAFVNAQAFDSTITADTPIYAVFYSGLQKLPVQARVPQGGKNYKVSAIPAGVAGQVYVMLSRSSTVFTDENFIAGPAILEVYPTGIIPSTPHPQCS